MANRREKNHREIGSFEDGNRNIVKKNPDQENKYAMRILIQQILMLLKIIRV